MRIQHNIAAMSSYRNYTNNVSAVNKNLEKLSSGYKINRAGDDAAGLAISEKMRAQISGLEAASKNAKDGISLVQTAEGALTEVHDMLNRMVTLATQSANGTYDDATDRDQLQKEMDQLKAEINRIADSSNFNGIKLLDGSMDTAAVSGATYSDVSTSDMQKLFVNGFTDNDWKGVTENDVIAGKNVLETEGGAKSTAGFQISLDGTTAVLGDGDAFNLDIGGQVLSTGAVDGGKTMTSTELAKALAEKNSTVTLKDADGNNREFNISYSGNVLTFTTTETDDFKMNTNAAVSWNVGAENAVSGTPDPDSDATKAQLTASVTLGGDAPANGDKITFTDVNGDEAIFEYDATEKEWTFDDTNSSISGYTGTFDGSTVTLTADNGGEVATNPFGNLNVSVTAAGTTTPTAEVGASSWEKGAAPAAAASQTVTIDVTGTPDADDVLTVSDDKGNSFVLKVNAGKWELDTAASKVPDGFTAALTADTAAKPVITITADEKGDVESPFGTFSTAVTNDQKTAVASAAMNAAGTAWTPGVDDPNAPKDGDSYGTINSGLQNVTDNNSGASAQLANTVVDFNKVGAWADGAKITIGDTTYTVALGQDSKFAGANNVIDLTDMESGSVDTTVAAQRLTVAAKDNSIFTVGHNSKGETTLQQKSSVKDTTDMTTKEKVASYLGVSLANPDSLVNAKAGTGLTLQIGDTAETYNQLKVSISDCHTDAMGIGNIDISTQSSAQSALDAIKNAINYVSDVRGTLGATQNRLEHTINNLSVMTENIQDAESTIRDTDIAEEMMAYTKNNILVQSAQAMLAQANQIPQGVLQLLG